MATCALFRLKFVLLLVLLSTSTASAQPASAPALQNSNTPYQNGIDLYEKGDFREAVKVFKEALKRDKYNVMLWHYLGLAYDGMGNLGDGRKAHDKAAKYGEILLTLQMGNARGPNYLDSLGSIASQLHFASSSATRYMQLSPDISKAKHSEAMDRAVLLSDVEKVLSGDDSGALGEIVSLSQATTKVKILSKPEPQYTEQARQHQTTGTVILRAILGRDGKVHAVIPVKSLPDGLTGRSILAALRISFEPATMNGNTVSVLVQLEYNFNLY